MAGALTRAGLAVGSMLVGFPLLVQLVQPLVLPERFRPTSTGGSGWPPRSSTGWRSSRPQICWWRPGGSAGGWERRASGEGRGGRRIRQHVFSAVAAALEGRRRLCRPSPRGRDSRALRLRLQREARRLPAQVEAGQGPTAVGRGMACHLRLSVVWSRLD